MRFRSKLPLIVFASFAIFALVVHGFIREEIAPRFLALERDEARENLDRTLAAVAREGERLAVLAVDIAGARGADGRPSLPDLSFLSRHGLAFVVRFAADASLAEAVYAESAMRDIGSLPLPPLSGRAFVRAPAGDLLLASAPAGEGALRGRIVVGLPLEPLLRELSAEVGARLSIVAPGAAPGEPSRPDAGALSFRTEADAIIGRTSLEGGALGIEARIPRAYALRISQALALSELLTLAFGLVGCLIIWLSLARQISLPIASLRKAVGGATLFTAYDGPPELSTRKDELGDLAAAFQELFDRLELGRRELVEANESLEAKVEERTRELRAATESLGLLAKVVESTSEAVIITDLEGRILKVNQAFCQGAGYAEEELLGRNPRIMKSDRHDSSFYEAMWAKLLGEGTWSGEVWDRRKEGEIYPKWLTINLLRDEAGEPKYYVGLSTDITRIKKAEERLHQLAYYDLLTELPNRSLFQDRLARAVNLSQRYGRRMALLFLDLDRFKYVNDSLGHQAGDALLVEVALRITSRVRGSDTVCRLGGDEFTLILDEITRSEDAGLVSQSILEELSKPFLIQGKELFVGASIGIAIFPYDDTTAEGLFRKADAAMYKAKEAGRNTYRFVSGETDALNKSRLDLEAELRRGFERGEFILHYQPLVRISDQRVIGAEALIRWERPGEPEPVLPGRFIELAEENGLIINLGEWVLLEACRRAAEWRERGLPLSVSVNISGRHFEHGGLGAQVAAALEASGLPPELLTIELTETTVMANVTTALRAMVDLKAIGVSLAIDDFGTGYSSLSYLGRFPIDRLKIDQSFVGSLGSAPNVSAIVSAVISMARSLGLETVAEGIETAEQLAYLTERGCGIAQGYLFSRALTSEAFFSYATVTRP